MSVCMTHSAVLFASGVLLLCHCRGPAAKVHVDINSNCWWRRDHQLWSSKDIRRFAGSHPV